MTVGSSFLSSPSMKVVPCGLPAWKIPVKVFLVSETKTLHEFVDDCRKLVPQQPVNEIFDFLVLLLPVVSQVFRFFIPHLVVVRQGLAVQNGSQCLNQLVDVPLRGVAV